MLQRTFFYCTLVCTSIIASAQDPHFTQYYSNPVYLNPSFAGDAEFARFNAVYRQQWPGIEKGFRTYHLAYDQYISKIRGGVAAAYMFDNSPSGTLQVHDARVAYAYHLQIKDQLVIKPSVQLGWQVKRLKLEQRIFDGTGWINDSTIEDRLHFFDLGFGILSYYKGLFAGASFNHVTRPNTAFREGSEANLFVKYMVHVGYSHEIVKDFSMGTSFLYIKQGPSNEKVLSGSFKYKWAKLDVGFRFVPHENSGKKGDAVLFAVGYESERLQVGYSFDYTISELTFEVSKGAHEAMLIYILRPKDKQKSILTTDNFMM